MPVDWPFASEIIALGGVDEAKRRITRDDAARQTETAKEILKRLRTQPGVLLADEVGMGKTYVAMAVIASVIKSTTCRDGPVVVMAPPGLRRKWQRDWEQFKRHCVRDHALDWVRDEYAHTPTDFFKLLDDPPGERARLIFVTTGCFSLGVHDPWVKLAMIRLARSCTRLSRTQKRRLYRWAPDLVRRFSSHKLTEDVVRRLMQTDVLEWKRILVAKGILTEDEDDPVPDRLSRKQSHLIGSIDWSPLCEVIRKLPGWRPQYVSQRLRNQVRRQFSEACRSVYEEWLPRVSWHSPLLVLDEAHHAKNDSTRLARLFRQESEQDVALLKDKFDRMLFLTATPFQLGHQELIRVLRSFKAVRWSPKTTKSPAGTREQFVSKMEKLEQALDCNRLAGRRFDRLWGKLRLEMAADQEQEGDEEQRVFRWWQRVKNKKAPGDAWERELLSTYEDCVKTKENAEKLLKPWLIRHNRPGHLPGASDFPRRRVLFGKAILACQDKAMTQVAEGLPIEKDALLPFLITARAQGQLAQCPGTRAFFAEGLASSYEAFHHTRDDRVHAKDFDDGLVAEDDGRDWIIPTRWYGEQIARLIPSREAPREQRLAHPKVSATVERAVDLWRRGEKVLVFCWYVQTARALYEHLREEVNQKVIHIAAERLGLDGRHQASEVQSWLVRIVRRLADEESPFHRELRALLAAAIDEPRYMVLRRYREQILGVLMAYFRSPSFVARYLPLRDPLVREALGERETRRHVIAAGVDALQRAIVEQKDASDQTYLGRVHQFLEFACELAERAESRLAPKQDESSGEAENPLVEYLDAVSIYSRPRRPDRADDDDEVEAKTDHGSYRVMPLVRMVYGETKTEIRDRLMLAFNSPLFPEILVSSSVMGEGVDLHRFCRHVIHHDLCWNPSTLEQRTGRLDRVGCKAEVCCRPIEVYEPFLAGSADEKMFRVLRDRERWFQIVMGQKYEFDEATSETIASRIPLPTELARQLTFDLSCWYDR